MTKKESFMAERILKNIDAFVSGQTNENSGQQSYTSLVSEFPFTSGKFKAKVANKLVHVPIKTFKKAMAGYMNQKDIERLEMQKRLSEIEDKIDSLKDSIDRLNDQTNRK